MENGKGKTKQQQKTDLTSISNWNTSPIHIQYICSTYVHAGKPYISTHYDAHVTSFIFKHIFM